MQYSIHGGRLIHDAWRNGKEQWIIVSAQRRIFGRCFVLDLGLEEPAIVQYST
jgi:hypothetical protein